MKVSLGILLKFLTRCYFDRDRPRIMDILLCEDYWRSHTHLECKWWSIYRNHNGFGRQLLKKFNTFFLPKQFFVSFTVFEIVERRG